MKDESLPADDGFGLDDFHMAPPEDRGLSLDELTQAYASLLSQGHDPYAEAPEAEQIHTSETEEGDDEVAAEAEDDEQEANDDDSDEVCRISPLTILEAMLFVGHPQNEPLTSERVASMMRGVRPPEIHDLVVQLNQCYDDEGCPYHVQSVGAGYAMVLREEFASIRNKFYGKIKAARLSQAAIDVLAIVAYKQPMTRDEVDELRNKGSGALLSQLVRRGLLRVERPDEKPRTPRYFTTQRFLELFGLESLRDLPKSPD